MGDMDSDSDGESGSDVDELLRLNQLAAKQELDEQKEKLLNELPQDCKDKFGAIGFGKWSKQWLPVLIRGPYDVGPGPVRNQWMDTYEKVKKKNRVANMPYLVYWYGSTRPEDYYTFLPQSNFIAYENKDKLKKNRVQYEIPEQTQAKLDTRPLREMLEDVNKQPGDRKRGDKNFVEAWELITMKDVNELLQQHGNESDSGEEKKPMAKKKKGKPGPKPKSKAGPKKRKRADEKDDSDPPERQKKTKKKGKSRSAEDVEISQEEKTLKLCKQAYLPTIKTWKSLIKNKEVSHIVQHLEKSVKSEIASYSPSFILDCGLQDLVRRTRSLFDEIPPENELAESAKQFDSMFDQIMDAKETSQEKGKNASKAVNENDFADDDVSSRDEKEEDAFVPEQSPDKTTKKTTKKSAGHEKIKVVKKKQKVKYKIAKQPKKNYETLVDAWKSALLSKDIDEVYRKVQEGSEAVNSYKLDDHFFSEMHQLVKDTRDLFKEDTGNFTNLDDAKTCLKGFKQTLRELYNANGNQSKRTVPRIVDAASEISGGNKVPKTHKDNGSIENKTRDGDGKAKTRTEDSGHSAGKDSSRNGTSLSPSRLPTKLQSQTKERKKFSLGSMIGSNAKPSSLNEVKRAGTERLPEVAPNREETKSDSSLNLPTGPFGQKVEQKPFSLGNMIRSRSKSSIVLENKEEEKAESKTNEPQSKPEDVVKETPSWMVEPVYPPKPIDSRRQRAIDFLFEATTMPMNRASAQFLDFEAICLSIEAAVFDWAKDTFSASDWESHYWMKVHEIVVAMSSTPKRERALIKRIANKEFHEAKNILDLNLEILTEGFEKFPMVMSNSDS